MAAVAWRSACWHGRRDAARRQHRQAPAAWGLAGLVLINLITAAVIITLLVLERGSQTKRGKLFLWALAITLIGLGLIEIAVA